MAEKKKAVVGNLDSVLLEIGEFGKYQFLNYVLLVIPVVFAALNNGNYIFSAADLEYRCYIPQCDLQNASLNEDWLHHAMPNSDSPRRCSRYGPSNASSLAISGDEGLLGSCSPESFNQNTVLDCEEWVFGEGGSIVKELGIQCQSWKRTLVGTIHSIGLLCALPLVASVSDKYGRRVALVSSAFLAGVFGVLRSFSTSYIMFVIFEFLEPAFGSGVFSSAFILGMELVGPTRRVLGATIIHTFYSSGAMLLGRIAWSVSYWRNLLRVIYIPSLLFISYFWLIEESVRWLISKEKNEKAAAILKKAAKINGVTLSEKSMNSLYSSGGMESKETDVEMKPLKEGIETKPPKEEEEVKPSSIKDAFKSRVIVIRLLTCSIWWVTCTFVYYGLSINAVSLTGNIYLNYILVSLVEVPAYFTVFMLLDRVGRKYTIFCAFLASGIACISFPLLPKDSKVILLITYLLGKYFITVAYSSLYVYTSELFPTCLRHSLLGICSMVGRIGSIVAPQAPLIEELMPGLSSFLFGGLSIVSGVLMLTSPETLNIKLPDTIEEAENIAKRKEPKTEA